MLENLPAFIGQSLHGENFVHEFPGPQPVTVDHVLPLVLTDGAVLVAHPVSARLHRLQDVEVGGGVPPLVPQHLGGLQVQQVQHQVGQGAELLRVLQGRNTELWDKMGI